MEKLYKKITGAVIAILLVSMLSISGQYFAIPAISALDQTKTIQTESNSTSLSIHSNTLRLANNQSIVFLPKHNNTTHVSTAFSTSKLAAKVGRSVANIGATLRNDGYCFPYAFLGESGCGNLQYNNGPVMHNVKILLIFWLGDRYSGDCSTSYYFESPINDPTATSPNDCSYMNLQVQFLKDMCSDPFMKIATQYTDTTGKAGPCTVYANAGNPWIDTNPFPHNPVLDVDLRAEAAKMLARMSLPASLNTQVYIFTPYGIDSCFDASGGFCFSNTFCAYHFGFGTINYVNMPDVSSFGSSCGDSPSPNNDPVADLEVNPLSHEVMESLTDPSGRGWMFNMMIDHEIGDQCTYDDLITVNSDNSDVHLGINGNPYFIQTEWSNSNGGCTLTDQSLPLPPFDPPTGITAVATSPSSIIISWATSLGATSYHVFRSTSPTGPFSTLVGTSLTTSLTDTGLSPGTQYYYEITASNTGGTSPMSKTPTSVNPSIINVIPISSAFATFTNPPAAQVAPISSKVMSISSISTTFTNPPTSQVAPISSKVMSISSISTTFTNPPTSQVAPISSKVTPISSKVTNVSSTTISISSIVSPASNSLIGTVHGYDFTTSIVPSTSRSLTGFVTPAAPAIVSPISNSLIGTVQEYGSTTSIVTSTSRSLTGVVTVITTGH